MSVRDGLLAILTLGPAYGHQLHIEFGVRAAHRTPVNVGQIYSTIDRLGRDDLITDAGKTADSLPLHGLTAAGRARADTWMSTPVGQPVLEWSELLDQLLVTATIDSGAAARLAAACHRSWTAELDEVQQRLTPDAVSRNAVSLGVAPSAAVDRLALLARQAQAIAVLAWLGSFVEAVDGADTVIPSAVARPQRGRRPRALVPD